MSTRDEILAALEAHPEGMTSKELAPLCPACECDPLVVGRTIAALRAENLIHPGTELREGGTIWLKGARPEERREAPITLAGAEQQPKSNVSDAALKIAAMRQPQTAARQAPDRAPMPETTPAPRPAAAPQEETMAEKKSVTERVIEALQKHGALALDQLAKHASTTKATLYTMMGTLQKKHGVVKVGRGVYDLKANKAAPPPRAETSSKERKAPVVAKKSNGTSPYASAVVELYDRRAALASEMEKLDNAIAAMEALAA